MVNGEGGPKPYIVIQAPAILDRLQHRNWIKNTCADLSNQGYTFFRASFPDERPHELYVEGWVVKPAEQGPCPWEEGGSRYSSVSDDRVRDDHKNREPRSAVTGDDGVCLLDGSPVKSYSPHVKKLKDGQQTSYVRMTDARIAGTPQVRPYQRLIRHLACMTLTEMHEKMAQTIARDPSFYKALFCAHCKAHFKVGPEGEFIWNKSDQRVGA